MRQVAIPGGPGVNVDAPGRVDADRVERLARHSIHDGNDVRVARVVEVVVLVDGENAVAKRAAAEAARKGQPGREATTEAERGDGSVGVLNQDAIVAGSTDIGEDWPVRKRLADADCMRQTHRIGDQIARDQRARRKIEAQDIELSVRQLRDDGGTTVENTDADRMRYRNAGQRGGDKIACRVQEQE